MSKVNSRVTSRGDEVEKRMDTVIPETRVTLDTGLLGENVVVLSLQVTHDFLEAAKACRHGQAMRMNIAVFEERTRIRCRCRLQIQGYRR